MESALNAKSVRELLFAITSLQTVEESRKFFRDLCTYSELKAMSERWQVAKQLLNGTAYRKISKNTGLSTATITRVAHWLHHGTGGYQFMLQKLKN